MTRIVRRWYPASALPEDLRGGVDPARSVLVTVEASDEIGARPAGGLSGLIGSGRGVYGSTEEIMQHLRALREDR